MAQNNVITADFEGKTVLPPSGKPVVVVPEAPVPAPNVLTRMTTLSNGARKSGFRWRLLSFFLVVVVPSVFGAIYFLFIASDQYVAEMRFGIRNAEAVGIESSGLLRGLGVADQSGMDSYAIVQFLQSREIVDKLQERVDIRKLFSNPGVEVFSRFNPERSVEDLVEYWKRQTDAYYETATGTVVVRTRAFTREDSLLLANTVLALSEDLVNGLSARARGDALKFAEADTAKAEARLAKAQLATRRLRDAQGILDPRKAAEGTLQLIDKLREEISTANAQLQSSKAYLSATAPSIQILNNKIASLKTELAKLNDEVTNKQGTATTNTSLSRIIGDYENAEIENSFAEKYYASSLVALQKARMDSERQQKYLATFVRPSLPEDALYPKRARNALTVLLASFVFWVVGMLGLSSVRDHL